MAKGMGTTFHPSPYRGVRRIGVEYAFEHPLKFTIVRVHPLFGVPDIAQRFIKVELPASSTCT